MEARYNVVSILSLVGSYSVTETLILWSFHCFLFHPSRASLLCNLHNSFVCPCTCSFCQPLMITLPIHSLPAFIMWGRCSWKHLVLFQYLRVVLWLIGQGLLPEQSGKDVYRYIWTFPYRNFSNTAPLLYYGQFPMCQQNFHSPDILLQVLQWKNLMHNLWIDWRFVVVCFSFFRGLNSSS